MNTPRQDTKEEWKGKKETFEAPKVVDIAGKELDPGRLEDEDMEQVSGGGDLCLGGGLALDQ